MTKIEPIMTTKLLKVLDLVKGVKSEYLCIPRVIMPVNLPHFKLCGVSNNAICHIANLQYVFTIDNLLNEPLWTNPNLNCIVLMTKEINPFIKLLTDYATAKAIKDNKLSANTKKVEPMLVEQALPMFTFLEYDTSIVNNREYAIGRKLYALDHNNQILENLAGNNTLTRSIIELFPEYIVTDPVEKYYLIWINSHSVCEDTDISSDEAFLDILSLKASDGARIWCPDVVKYGDKLKPYIFYMNKTILNNVKGDKILLSIHDQIPGMDSRYFMVKITVVKMKKKILSTYDIYLMCIKVN